MAPNILIVTRREGGTSTYFMQTWKKIISYFGPTCYIWAEKATHTRRIDGAWIFEGWAFIKESETKGGLSFLWPCWSDVSRIQLTTCSNLSLSNCPDWESSFKRGSGQWHEMQRERREKGDEWLWLLFSPILCKWRTGVATLCQQEHRCGEGGGGSSETLQRELESTVHLLSLCLFPVLYRHQLNPWPSEMRSILPTRAAQKYCCSASIISVEIWSSLHLVRLGWLGSSAYWICHT